LPGKRCSTSEGEQAFADQLAYCAVAARGKVVGNLSTSGVDEFDPGA
jgi:hypothetical protein